MVKGLESFIEQFREFPNCYTVIGGAACDILMTEAGLDFRATKDIDMILVLEGDFPGFGHKFWEYIKKGGFRCGLKYRRALYQSILMMRHPAFLLSYWMIITTG